jgi:hypothetical protein
LQAATLHLVGVMAVDATSTLAEVQAEHENTAGYDVHNSPAECGRYIIATRILISRRYEELQQSGPSGMERVRHDLERLENLLKTAENWGASNGTGSTATAGGSAGVRYGDLRRSRR